MTFPKFHGITLAQNAWIANAVVESLAADPAPLVAGRIWFNSTAKTLSFSSLDSGGAVVVQTFASGSDITAALAAITALGARVTTLEGAFVNKDGSVAFTGNVDAGSNKVVNVANGTLDSDAVNKAQLDAAIGNLANAFDYIGVVAGGADTGSALDLTTESSTKVGSYYKVTTAGYFKVGAEGTPFFANINDGLVFNTTAGVDIIDNQTGNVTGTAGYVVVTGSAATGFAVDLDPAFKTTVSANTAAIAAETTRAEAAEGDLTTLTTTAKSSLVAAINEVDADVATNASGLAAEVSRATGAEGTLTTNLGAEVSRATGAEGTLTTNLAAEVSRATGVEGTLSSLTTAVKTDLVSAINSEAARAAAAEGVNGSAISAEVSRATAAEGVNASAISAEVSRATAAEGVNASAISAEVTRAEAAEGVLTTDLGDITTLTTTNKTSAVAAINELVAAAGEGAGALKAAINAQRFTYLAVSGALSFVVSHGLNSAFVAVTVLVKGDDGVFRNDMVAVEETDSNTTTVTLTESRIIKATFQAVDQLA